MKVLFVHGFGGAGGQVERALVAAAHGGVHDFVPVRWGSGDLRVLRTRALVAAAREMATGPTFSRSLLQAAIRGARTATDAWDRAVANVPVGATRLLEHLESSQAEEQRVSIVAFSLGCRVVLEALGEKPEAARGIDRLVFAGSAAPASAYEVLPRVFPETRELRLVHVFSRSDDVLDKIYPFGAGAEKPSGRGPLAMAGVDNIEVGVGHTGYASIADRLWALATGEVEAPTLR